MVMATLNDLVDETLQHLAGYSMRQDALTHLMANITSTDVSLSVANAESVGKGIIEIDDEMIWIDTFDRNTGVLTVPPYGRGYMNSVSASHTSGTMITINPTFPRHMVRKAINDTILAVGSSLFGVNTYTFTYSPAVTTYSLPDEADGILAVSFQAIGPTKEWVPVRGWRLDKMANPSALNSSKSITLLSAVDPGVTVQVTYIFDPEPLESSSDDFSAVTGLPDSCKDVVVLGAAYRLLSFVDPGRLTYVTPEADVQGGRVGFGSGTNVARYVFALFQQRLQEETARLQGKYPVRVHYTN
jgi:hypothetical protein